MAGRRSGQAGLGGLPPSLVSRSIELFAGEVAAVIRKKQAPARNAATRRNQAGPPRQAGAARPAGRSRVPGQPLLQRWSRVLAA